MKSLKWFLIATSAIVALILVSCAPLPSIISSVTQNIVEVTANSTDSDLLNLASWCDSKPDILMLWYDFDNQPTGFTNRSLVFSVNAADKNVYLNNEFVGNYDMTDLDTIKNTIDDSKTTFDGTLILYLRADDLLGTSWDLIIGEAGQTKVPVTNYVLVEFKREGSVYKVTKVQAGGDWQNFTVPKDMTLTDIETKGFAFFRIDDDKVVDARVIYPQ
ncbi:hypothetical protein AJ81_04745 [Pseudothermotoga hypogea DSM 11164 = NBRC 106472]|uniref:Uncharacterized protein n=1 Tax=Pseudothermotoga hypogea DSM 11164 = NBRC 106472 TaxID=1123384 RepID=A0A0X1KU21_9THEM|nr:MULTISPECIES: hypothetical protein [Pseudothermotoga]AJC74723.1 hypothetical protein AJ81_04745 [Pseudothermotoga hypogea DSM 11164 = NBRC 106472]MDI6861978.1 hypothetical protein [Pseudothermotoga sp.]